MHNIRVFAMSPTLEIADRLRQQGVQVKIHDPLYSEEEVRRVAGVPAFRYPDGLREFEAVLITSGHRQYRSVPYDALLSCLSNCKLVLDNAMLWRDVDFRSRGIEYHASGDAGWLTPM
jgi:UDP-N-acetyl-D-mannosaminuronate dehydrogenase